MANTTTLKDTEISWLPLSSRKKEQVSARVRRKAVPLFFSYLLPVTVFVRILVLTTLIFHTAVLLVFVLNGVVLPFFFVLFSLVLFHFQSLLIFYPALRRQRICAEKWGIWFTSTENSGKIMAALYARIRASKSFSRKDLWNWIHIEDWNSFLYF